LIASMPALAASITSTSSQPLVSKDRKIKNSIVIRFMSDWIAFIRQLNIVESQIHPVLVPPINTRDKYAIDWHNEMQVISLGHPGDPDFSYKGSRYDQIPLLKRCKKTSFP